MKMNSVCAFCSCLCDDIRLDVVEGRITDVQHTCALGTTWFNQPIAHEEIRAHIDGTPVDPEQAIAEAARVLKQARAPLICGMAAYPTEAQQQAVALADVLGAYIDPGTSSQSDIAFTQYGISTTTLGEVKKRADLVLCLGADPMSTHPRFFERYLPKTNCKLIVVDEQPNASTAQGASFVPLPAKKALDWFAVMRSLVKGKSAPNPQNHFSASEIETMQALVEQLKHSRYSLIVLGHTYQSDVQRHFVAEALAQLVADLNQFTRCVILALSNDAAHSGVANLVGASNVLAWQTGYGQAVSFSRGFPNASAGEFSATQLLERGEVDVVLWLSDGGLPQLSPEALAHWQRIPKVALTSTTLTDHAAMRVVLPTAISGLQVGGTAYRLDGVSLPLRPSLPAILPSAERLLADLYQHICLQSAFT